MTIAGSPIKSPAPQPDRATVVSILRWNGVIPAYLITLVVTFIAVWIGGGIVTGLGDDGPSWFSIVMVLSATFAAVSVSALVAPKFKLIVAGLFALATVCLVPYPYTSQTSGDGEAIPPSHELTGVILGSILAVVFIFFRSRSNKKLWRGRPLSNGTDPSTSSG